MNNKVILKIISSVLLFSMLVYTSPVFALTKEEIVYSRLDVNGFNYNTIVNSHLKNDNGESLINDLSDLINIENVSGDEGFNQSGNSLVWNADGSDIYYQGESQKELPIEYNVKYMLDGNEISPQNLAGKSGCVKIIIEYKNKDEHFVNINGKNEKLYTPFVVVCGTVLDNKNNRDISISNGRVIDNGNKTFVVGMCVPGLQESLNISNFEFNMSNCIEITMESNDFELGNMVSFVSPKVLENSDLDLFDKLDGVYSKVNLLESSANELEVGANILMEGANIYSQKSKEFYGAMKQVSTGASSASSNYLKIDNGISSLNKSSKSLENGAKNVSDGTKAVCSNLNVISNKLGELQAGTKSLQNGEASLNAGLDKIISSVNEMSIPDNSAKIKELEMLVKTNESTIKSLKDANLSLSSQIDSLNASIKNSSSNLPNNGVSSTNVNNADISDQIKSQIDNIKTQITTNKSLINLLETNVKANKEIISSLKQFDSSILEDLSNGLGDLKHGINSVQAGTSRIYEGQNSLKDGVDLLASKSDELYKGSTSLYQGTVKLSEGTSSLNSGSFEMKNGLDLLDNGAIELVLANEQLTNGASSLAEGSFSLANGVSKFNNDGIKPVCNFINGNLKDVSLRLEKLQDLANEYNNFTMLSDGCNGDVKFVMIMDSIKKLDISKQEVILNNEHNFKIDDDSVEDFIE